MALMSRQKPILEDFACDTELQIGSNLPLREYMGADSLILRRDVSGHCSFFGNMASSIPIS